MKNKIQGNNTSGKVAEVSGVALTSDNARPENGNNRLGDRDVVYMCETILGYLDMGMVDRAKQHLENLQRWFVDLPTEGELFEGKFVNGSYYQKSRNGDFVSVNGLSKLDETKK